jgi:hypothetical protein
MKASQTFIDNAERCEQLADEAQSQPDYRRFKRMEAALRDLAIEQDWLDGEIPPARIVAAPKRIKHNSKMPPRAEAAVAPRRIE